MKEKNKLYRQEHKNEIGEKNKERYKNNNTGTISKQTIYKCI
jgi:hypothetical protein